MTNLGQGSGIGPENTPEPIPEPGSKALAPKLTLPVKLAYGAGDLGAGLTSQFLSFFLLIFLIDVAGMSPLVAGSVLAFGKVWDAINDPLVGMLSDRTKTRWGRRYPWMFLTAIPFGLSYFLIWIKPGFENPSLQFWYYVVITTLFQVFFTTTNLPYTALTAEMSNNYDEGTELTSFRLAFSVAGGVAILVIAGIAGQLIQDEAQRYMILGIAGGLISVFSIYWCIFGTYGYTHKKALVQKQSLNAMANPEEISESFFQQLRLVLSNRPFLFVVGIYMFSWLALQITAAIIPFYAKFWMETDGSLVALLVQGPAVIMMFVCARLSKRIGKKNLYFLGSGLWILVQTALYFLQPGQTSILYGLCLLASFSIATAYIVPWSILPDVIDFDELKTGQRREGTFYAFMTLLQKFGLAIGLFLVGAALEASGFAKDSATQPDSALDAIRFFIGPVPLLFVICGAILVYFYPITREAHTEIMLKLAERKRLACEGVEGPLGG
jgi:glycoside/pentoside/hexuronide:cation symporter, GPH family